MRVKLSLALIILTTASGVSVGLFWESAPELSLFSVSILLGAACNALAVFYNGGRMPVYGYTEAMSRAHCAAGPWTRVGWLCDWVRIGRRYTASPGDFLIVLGLAGYVVAFLFRVVWVLLAR